MRLSATLVAVNVSAMNIFTSIFTEAERQVLNDLLFIQSREYFTRATVCLETDFHAS